MYKQQISFRRTVFVAGAFSLAAACSSETSQAEDGESPPAENAALQGDVILKDSGGAELVLACDEYGRPEAYMRSPGIDDFSVGARLRFQGGDADKLYRERLELDRDEDEGWIYNDEKGAYEISHPTVFFDAFFSANRIFVDVMPFDDTPAQAAVFDIASTAQTQKTALKNCQEENAERVTAELTALGLVNSEPRRPYEGVANYDVDLDKVMSVLRAMDDQGLLQEGPVVDRLHELARSEKEMFFSALVTAFESENPEKYKAIEAITADAGYEIIEDLELDGNAVFQAINVLTLKNGDKEFVRQLEMADEDARTQWKSDNEKGALARIFYAVPETLLNAVEPHYDYLVLDRADVSSGDSGQIDKYRAYMAAFPDVREVMPKLSPEEQREYRASFNGARSISDMLEFFRRNHASETEALAATVSIYGFESLDDWATAGDGFRAGIALTGMERAEPGRLDRGRAELIDVDIASLSAIELDWYETMQSYTSAEWAFFEDVYDEWQALWAEAQ